MATTSKGLSIRAYADHRKRKKLHGCSPWSVKKALRDGRISKNEHGKIDPKTADRQWKQNTNPAQQRDTAVQSAKTKQRRKNEAKGNAAQPGVPSYSQSRAMKEVYQARIARLQYEEMTSTLVKADAVKVEAFRRARMVRDQILTIPDRVSSMLAAEDDADQIRNILDDELRNALEALSHV